MLSKILCASMIFGSVAVYAQNNPVNMSDSLDKNMVPASEEQRKNVEKPINLPDRVDQNAVPAPFEERQLEEEAIGTESSEDLEKKDQQKMEDHSDHSMDKQEEPLMDDSSIDASDSTDSM